jgi:hypothetical protein
MMSREFLLHGVIHLGITCVLLLGAILLLLRVVRRQRQDIERLNAVIKATQCTFQFKPRDLIPISSARFTEHVVDALKRMRRNEGM